MKRRNVVSLAGGAAAYWIASCRQQGGAQPAFDFPNLSTARSPQSFTVLHAFSGPDGRVPFGSLTISGDTLFGNTYRGGQGDYGVVFAIARDGSDYRVLHHFSGKDGREPYHKLWVKGDRLYGITKFGGNADNGVLFEMGTDGSQFRILHHFDRVDNNGSQPHAGPILVGDRLYGTVYHGGRYRWPGAIYSYDLGNDAFELLHDFDPTQSQHPTGRLTFANDYLYGTASDFFVDNRLNRGSLFRLRLDGSEYKTLYRFQGKADSGYPYDELLFDGDRYLYGTAYGDPGQPQDSGSIYRFDTTTQNEFEVLHELGNTQTEGSKPNGSLALAPNGKLYGTTHGTNALRGDSFGSLFSMQPDGSEFEVLHRFDGGKNGDTPMRTPAISDGILYGTTAFGGGTQTNDPNTPSGYGLIYAAATA
ncbi:MAG: choice-of-anchor tandem repeat GloVer-containing protein [Cyanobacteria bacterium P01_D01_bin.123]